MQIHKKSIARGYAENIIPQRKRVYTYKTFQVRIARIQYSFEIY